MATFGPIASAAPNVLFDAAKLDRDVQGFQRNQLLMQNAQQDQKAQMYEKDANARIGLARSLINLPEDQAAAQWGQERARLQAAGFGEGLPEAFPGMERLKAVASSDLTTFQRLQIDEKRRLTEAMSGLVGGGAAPVAATPGYTPVSMGTPMQAAAPAQVGGTGSIRADNADAAARREWAMANLSGTDLDAELAAISQGRVTALTGQRAGTQFRANEGVGGVYAGIPAPAPGVPVLSGGGSGGSAAGQNGLTAEQTNTLRALVLTNPGGVPAMRAQFLQQNAMAQERAGDNARRDAQFQASQQQQAETNRRAEEALRLQRDAAERAERAARRQEEQAGIPSGYRRNSAGGLEPIPGGPADKPETNNATEGERKAGAFLERMQGAEDLLQGMVKGGYDPSNTRDKVANAVPLVGNFLTSERGQQYLNAASEWARAKLRLESGAVIGDDEARQEARTYFPMPGDSQETIAQKQALRDNAMQAIRRMAGRSAPSSAAPAAPSAGGASPAPGTPPLPPGFQVVQ